MSDEVRLPKVTRDYAFFFAGLARHQLLVQECDVCAAVRHPPAPMCASCHSFDWTAVELAGEGRLHSFVIHHKPALPHYPLPHVIGLVDMDRGMRVMGALAGVEPDAVRIGMALRVGFAPVDGIVLHHFTPAQAG